MRKSVIVAALAAFAATPTLADGKKDCTTEPKSAWKEQKAAEAEASKAGYEVRRSKIEGACYEVYGVKDGQLYELFYSPVDLKLMATVKK